MPKNKQSDNIKKIKQKPNEQTLVTKEYQNENLNDNVKKRSNKNNLY
jgi:hypothetical protein